MRTLVKALLAVCVVNLGSVSAGHADPDQERAVLARVAHELRLLESLIQEAQGYAQTGGRYRFQYAQLQGDVARVRLGIQDYLDGPRRAPREVEPLRGDYRR